LPEFTAEFSLAYPKLMKEPVSTVQEALYETKIGRVTRLLSFIQKGQIKKTMNCVKILTRVLGPDDFLEQKTSQGKYLWKWFCEVNKDYEALKEQVGKPEDDLLLFTYTEDKMSFTSDLSNELIYRFPHKTILICRQKGLEMKCSIRNTDKVLPPAINKSLQGLTGYGGGHDHACGICVNIDDFNVFLERLKKELK
ncbi:DHH family phosphoesterase, partial [Candidatus Woesearchaeota archaeon]|nr:DHH family phosphoesterase [Candidatus Woesearchaeota archaeon]